MKRSDQLLKTLLKQSNENHISSNWLYTMYIPTLDQTSLDIKRIIKSRFIEDVNQVTQLKDKKVLHDSILNNIDILIDDLKDLSHGLGIFININYDLLKDHRKPISIENIILHPLYNNTNLETSFGHAYMLDQLIYDINGSFNALIINLKDQIVEIKYIDDANYESKEEINNINKEFHSVNSKPKDGGDYNFNRIKEDNDNDLVIRVMDHIITKYPNKEYDFIQLSFSSNFTKENLIKHITKYLGKEFEENIIIKDTNETKKSTIENVRKIQMERKMTRFRSAKNMNNLFSMDNFKIVESLIENNVEILFMENCINLKAQDVLSDEERVLLDSQEGIDKTIMFTNWMILKALNSSAEVVILEPNSLDKSIAIKKRY